MTWVTAALGTVGFLIVLALQPGLTRAYVEAAGARGPLAVVAVVLTTLLAVPNAGIAAGAAAMGGSVSLAALERTCSLVSYSAFPQGVAVEVPSAPATGTCPLPVELGPAPLPYFLFLLVPLVATLVGGRLAAQRAGSVTRADAAATGAAAGVVFALMFLVLAWASRFSTEVAASFLRFELAVGAELVSGVLLALLWGAAGGALGGAVAEPRQPPSLPGFTEDAPRV